MTKSLPKINKQQFLTIILIVAALLIGFSLGNNNTRDAKHHLNDELKSNDHHSNHQINNFEVSQEDAPKVKLQVSEDQDSGWNIRITTDKFKFTPLKIGQADTLGEGHAHLFVDGQKVARLYSEYYHYNGVFDGTKEFKVVLVSNMHGDYTVNGKAIADSVTVSHMHE